MEPEVHARLSLTLGNKPITIEGPPDFLKGLLSANEPLGMLLSQCGEPVKTIEHACDPVAEEQLEAGLKHAWEWFSTHAGQRMHSVNFFLVASAFLCTGFVTALRYNAPAAACGIGVVGAFSAFLFRKLENRVRLLVKAGENAMAPFQQRLAKDTGNDALRICELVEEPPVGIWKYSETFRWLHNIIGGGFFCGSIYAVHVMTRATTPVVLEYVVSMSAAAALSVAVIWGGLYLFSEKPGDERKGRMEFASKWARRVSGAVIVLIGIAAMLFTATIFFIQLFKIYSK